MKTIPQNMLATLEAGLTQHCWCWRIVRKDGVVLGFTDHDADLEFDGTRFEARSAFTATALEENLGLGVDNLDVETALRTDSLREEDLRSGLFDDARIEIFRVSWQDVSRRYLVKSGTLGEIRFGDGFFSGEIRGLAHQMQQPRGHVYQFACDAVLGDGRCQVPLENSAFTQPATLVNKLDNERIRVSLTAPESADLASGWFSGGQLVWQPALPGAAKQKYAIKSHQRLSADNTTQHELSFWHSPFSNLSGPVLTGGDSFTLVAGCDKRFDTCRDKFVNTLNFRGFPHIPGNDFLFSFPRK